MHGLQGKTPRNLELQSHHQLTSYLEIPLKVVTAEVARGQCDARKLGFTVRAHSRPISRLRSLLRLLTPILNALSVPSSPKP